MLQLEYWELKQQKDLQYRQPQYQSPKSTMMPPLISQSIGEVAMMNAVREQIHQQPLLRVPKMVPET